MPQVPTGANTAYSVTAEDFQGSCYRINVILQQINARLTTLQAQEASAASAPSSGPMRQALSAPWIGSPNTARSLATIYQNTGASPIWVNAILDSTTTSIFLTAYSDAQPSPSTVVAETYDAPYASATVIRTLSFIVLPGYYYKITGVGSTTSIVKWVEWQ